jgi:hypothetical protein
MIRCENCGNEDAILIGTAFDDGMPTGDLYECRECKRWFTQPLSDDFEIDWYTGDNTIPYDFTGDTND